MAQRQLVDRYGPVLMTVCRRYASKLMDPQDILQEAFINIFKNLEKIDPKKGSPQSYMVRICINAALSMQLKAKKHRHEDLETTYGSSVSMDAVVLDKLDAEYLMEMISELPHTLKSVFNLYIIDGYSHREIGNIMEITESSSRAYLTRARKLLQSKLIQNEETRRYGAV